MNVFRIATKQAIRDIVTENASENRFGFTVTEDNLESITDRVVDLFEMTLNLRSRLGMGAASPAEAAPAEQPKSQQTRWQTPSPATSTAQQKTSTLTREPVGFPRTTNAAEIYDGSLKVKSAPASETILPPHVDFKLPRKRTLITAEEKEKLTRS